MLQLVSDPLLHLPPHVFKWDNHCGSILPEYWYPGTLLCIIAGLVASAIPSLEEDLLLSTGICEKAMLKLILSTIIRYQYFVRSIGMWWDETSCATGKVTFFALIPSGAMLEVRLYLRLDYSGLPIA